MKEKELPLPLARVSFPHPFFFLPGSTSPLSGDVRFKVLLDFLHYECGATGYIKAMPVGTESIRSLSRVRKSNA
jgi:hypothetical protein